jgi:biopolymer transport protein ExbD
MAMSSGSDDGVFSEINITPLTDIFLVLLIIFMVTTAVTIESAAHVDLPKAENPNPNQTPKGVIVTYTSEHQIFVNERNVSERDLEPALRDVLSKSADKIVVFQGDPKVLIGDMVRILDVAKRAGAEQIAIAASKSAPGGAPGGGPASGS